MKRSIRNPVVISLVLIFVLIFLGEVGIFYICSWWWQWPEISEEELMKSVMHEPAGLSKKQLLLGAHPPRYHYQNGDVHYYTRSVINGHVSEGPARAPGATKRLQVMILSDPHIMCTYDKEEFGIARWDADRYLATSYRFLLSALRPPDLIIFLGDIFSDGFQASEQQWQDYTECLRAIFPPPSPKAKQMFILGDNDIGGEGRDLMTEEVIEIVTQKFGELNTVTTHKGAHFVKLTTPCFINRFSRTNAETSCKVSLMKFLHVITKSPVPSSQYDKDSRKQDMMEEVKPWIGLSHVPLSSTSGTHFQKQLLDFGFDYVISGHIHHEKYYSHLAHGEAGSKVLRVTHEITVPTCSYRMGEAYPGIGLMVIDSNGDVSYRVLWLPQRYPFFAGYLLSLAVFLMLLCCKGSFKYFRK